jgi:predicted DNA-binding antitoxin AbrB/MazE fold protein
MTQLITATFVDGMLKPDEELGLATGTKVRLILDLADDVREQRQAACAELDRLCDDFPIESRGQRLTRDQLHERR